MEYGALNALHGKTERNDPLVYKIKEKMKKMSNKEIIVLTQEELKKEIERAFIHGQGNAQMMEAGLERDEVEDYVNSRMYHLINQNKHE